MVAPELRSKLVGARLRRGQRLRIESPGGGGWGDPREREPERVAHDVRRGHVSAEAARRDYGVVLGDDGEVDEAATARERGAASRARGRAMTSVAGVDVGGTFTDILVLDEATRLARTAKVPSTRTREAAGFLAGLRAAGAAPDGLAAIVHGTTVGTNALLERTGARCGLIVTEGFADVLDMRRRDRPRTWGLRGDFEPVVPRDLRVEVAERTGADGEVVRAVDPGEVRAAARTLLERGAEAAVVVFVNAYASDANELVALDALREEWPNQHVGASSAILAEIREFERFSTTALNGYLQPVVGPYLEALERDLGAEGFAGQFLVVQSNGGVITAEEARRLPIRTTLSGPAAGVIAAARCAADAGLEDVITCDMGGTSFDVALVAGGRAAATQEAKIDFGLVVRTPMIEITTIGAGGGSIARVDAGGLLRVGPDSAGSVPGPACYGQGNERPTVTDANLVLGRIDAERPLGGDLDRLDTDAARAALERHVGEPLGLDAVDAAAAVVEVANARLAGAIRLISVERGPRPGALRADAVRRRRRPARRRADARGRLPPRADPPLPRHHQRARLRAGRRAP